LFMGGLTSLDIDTAMALTAYAGELLYLRPVAVSHFIRQHPFGKDTALAHAAVRSGDLQHVKAFEFPDSVAIATALAMRKGPLSLPNLKKISPKTLAALVEKRDVAIPLIETLEFIPEPDGSTTEDFVIPEWLEAQQRAAGSP
jgi:hypothetical protein